MAICSVIFGFHNFYYSCISSISVINISLI